MMTGCGVNDCTESIEFLIYHKPTRNVNHNNDNNATRLKGTISKIFTLFVYFSIEVRKIFY